MQHKYVFGGLIWVSPVVDAVAENSFSFAFSFFVNKVDGSTVSRIYTFMSIGIFFLPDY